MAAVSILGWFPQSAQYMVLKGNAGLEKRIKKLKAAEKAKGETIYVILPSLRIHYDGVRLVDHARDEGLAVLP